MTTKPGTLTKPARRDCTGGLKVGVSVRVNDDVHRYGGRVGVVAEVRRVVPKAIADKLHREGRTTNNGDFEIGVDFSSPDAVGGQTDAWFLPRELAAVNGAPRRYKAPRSHAKARRGETHPEVAA